MNDYILIQKIKLDITLHKPTGKTKHFHGVKELPIPYELRIIRYDGNSDGNSNFYLFYCDIHGNELTDTYHETLDSAVAQAEWEFGILPNEWDKL